MTQTRTDWNSSRFKPEDPNGFYESYFQRANHATRPLAFWIRFTSFSPRGWPDKACGELWAIYFDGETNRITAVKEAVPISQCSFSRTHGKVNNPPVNRAYWVVKWIHHSLK